MSTSSATNLGVEVRDTSLNGQKFIVLQIPQTTLQKDVDKTSSIFEISQVSNPQL
jgi:hypothetical protein